MAANETPKYKLTKPQEQKEKNNEQTEKLNSQSNKHSNYMTHTICAWVCVCMCLNFESMQNF